VVSRFVRKVRTSSGAVAVQIVRRRRQRVELVEQVGSAHTDAEFALLLATAREGLNPGQGTLDLGDVATVAPPGRERRGLDRGPSSEAGHARREPRQRRCSRTVEVSKSSRSAAQTSFGASEKVTKPSGTSQAGCFT
jgi:hypothetical protein